MLARKFHLLLCVIICVPLYASDAFFVRFRAEGRQTPTGNAVLWGDDIIFYNTTSQLLTVRFVGLSNGTPVPSPLALTLLPHRATHLSSVPDVFGSWSPVQSSPMWLLHLDVPNGVVAESRDEYHVPLGVSDIPGLSVPGGKVSLPIFRTLTAAGQPQVHLGTDLGGLESRINVSVYNAGADSAAVSIEVRRVCNDALVDTRSVAVPPNTLIQIGGLTTVSSAECLSPTTEPWSRFTVVTATQPSLSFVSNINEAARPSPADDGAVPVVGLGIARNEQF